MTDHADTVEDIKTAKDGLTIAEAAERMGVQRNTIHNWINRGELPAVKFGRQITRIAHGDLDRLRRTT